MRYVVMFLSIKELLRVFTAMEMKRHVTGGNVKKRMGY